MRVLLLENVSAVAVSLFRDAGYDVESHAAALEERELIEKIRGVSILGVRSKTRVSAAVIEAACSGTEEKEGRLALNATQNQRRGAGAPADPSLAQQTRSLRMTKGLLAIGAFCIGVDKIDRAAASELGVAVFNDPHSNSRSVAELAMGEIVLLVRRIFFASSQMHEGVWNKSAAGAHEVRGLTLGIVGYGKIGSQLSDLAEAMGMRVVFYDVSHVLARGNARPVGFR